MKIVIFSGGSGSIELQKGIISALGSEVELSVIINAFDNGLSTGEVRKAFNGKILGPSDLRKNQTLRLSNNLKIVFDTRINATSIDDLKNIINGILSDKNLLCLSKYVNLFFNNIENTNLSYKDFNIGNVIYAGLASENNFSLKKAGEIIKSDFNISTDVLLSTDNSLFLHAITKKGIYLMDEADIVSWNNDKDPIQSIFFTDKDGNKTQPILSEECKTAISNADIIIYSAGTQWSSLIPTYEHIGFKECLEKSKAKQYFIMNNVDDLDLKGISSNSIIKLLSNYLNFNNITIVMNDNAIPLLKQNNYNYNIIRGILSESNSKKHNGDKLFNLILSDYYKIINSKYILSDLDGTLIDKHTINHSYLMNFIFNKKIDDNFYIVTGNSLKHVNNIFKEVLKLLKEYYYKNVREPAIHPYNNEIHNSIPKIIFCDGGNSICKFDPINNCYTYLKNISNEFLMDNVEIKKIYDILKELNIVNTNIENRHNSIVSIKPYFFNKREMLANSIKTRLGNDFEVALNGKSTIDIYKRGYAKDIVLKYKDFNNKKIVYIADELQRGNDAIMKIYKNINCIDVNFIENDITKELTNYKINLLLDVRSYSKQNNYRRQPKKNYMELFKKIYKFILFKR